MTEHIFVNIAFPLAKRGSETRYLIVSIDATYNMKNTDITITKVTMILTALAIITAPFDELFVIEVGGLTLRFSLIFIMAACFCLLMGWRQRKEILVPVGSNLLISLLILNGVFSFINSSGSLMMQLGYQIWFALDVMLVLLCVNLFLKDKHLLFILWTGVFLAMAVICIIQLFLGIWGISFYQEQYFGRLPLCLFCIAWLGYFCLVAGAARRIYLFSQSTMGHMVTVHGYIDVFNFPNGNSYDSCMVGFSFDGCLLCTT